MNGKRLQRRRILLVLLLALIACLAMGALAWTWLWNNLLVPPGQGSRAERGFQAAEPILQAIDRYHADTGEYPESLEALAPQYLPETPTGPEGIDFIYRKTGTSFSLEFSYVGPGMNRCAFTPETDWDCSGYY